MKSVDVLIVGGGPAGIILSMLLKRCGVSNLLIEKKTSLSNALGAHYVGNRTMEVLRHLGHIDRQCQSLSAPVNSWRYLQYSESVRSTPIAMSDSFSRYYLYNGTYFDPYSPSKVANISQNRIVSLLQQSGFGGRNVLWGTKFVGTESVTDSEIVAKIANSEGLTMLKCKYLIGADGVHSDVREDAGIAYNSFDGCKGYFVSVQFRSSQLERLVRDNPFMIKFVFDKRPGTLVWYRGDEFVLHIPCLTRELQQLEPDFCSEYVYDVLGVPFEIKNITKWVQNLAIARDFTNEYGNVILVGDAAHQFIPTGGFGMNTGISDVYSLYWRLYTVLNDGLRSRDRIGCIKAYVAERLLVSHYLLRLIADIYQSATVVPSMLGYYLPHAKSVTEALSVFLPKGVIRKTLDFGYNLMRGILPKRAEAVRKEATEYLTDENCPFRFIYTGADLNLRFIYEEGGDYLTKLPRRLKAPESAWRYRSGPLIGRRIPHAWVYCRLEDESGIARVIRLSTLDLTSMSTTPRFVELSIGYSGGLKGYVSDTLRVVWSTKGVYIDDSYMYVDIIDSPLEPLGSNGANLLYSEFTRSKNGILEVFSSESVLNSFKAQSELGSGGVCIIIRPDAIVVDLLTNKI